MEIRFDGQAALVTGAASGIGRAIAIGFAESGADLVLVDTNADGVRETARVIREAAGRRTWAHALDITNRQACRRLARTVGDDVGTLHHLVNAAGIDGKGDIGSEAADAVWDRVIDVNVNGTYNVTSAFAEMIVASKGSILNVGSTMSFVGHPRMAAYTASKAAIHNFTQSLAIELADRGVRVNMLAPGVTDTGLTAGLLADKERLAPFMSRACLGRVGRPEEMVGPALLLCSTHASYITGATIRVDGGWLAR